MAKKCLITLPFTPKQVEFHGDYIMIIYKGGNTEIGVFEKGGKEFASFDVRPYFEQNDV